MFVAAHPDDIECGAGGLIRILTRQGTKVVYVITTNGDKGCGSPFCANYSSVQLAQARAGEAVGAAAVLGVPAQNVVLMDYEDGMITRCAAWLLLCCPLSLLELFLFVECLQASHLLHLAQLPGAGDKGGACDSDADVAARGHLHVVPTNAVRLAAFAV